MAKFSPNYLTFIEELSVCPGIRFSIFEKVVVSSVSSTQMVAALVHINITVTRNFHKSEKVKRLSNMAKWTVTH